jgi:tetratricopeptide (TPR) repeat protein
MQALLRLRRIVDAEQDALALLARAELDPDASAELMEQARRSLAAIYWMLDKKDEALEQYNKATTDRPTTRSTPVFTNLLLGAASGNRDARDAIQYVLERRPRDGMALTARFELERRSGDDDAALETAKLLAEVRGGDGFTLLKVAKLLRESGFPAEAAACYKAVIARSAPSADLFGYLGTSLLAAGDLDGAEEALAEAMRLRPDDPRGPFYLGNVALLKGDERSAEELYRRSLSLDPRFVPPLVNLARYLAAQGRVGEAKAALQDALQRQPGHTEAAQLLSELRSATP